MGTLTADVDGLTDTTVVNQEAEAEELAGFEAAVAGTELAKETPKTETEETEEPESETSEAPETTEEASTTPTEEVKPAVPPAVSVTEDQLKELMATSGSVKELTDGLKKLRDDAFGKIGGIERLIKQAEKMTDSKLDLTLTDEDFAEVDSEVPMLTKPLQKLFTKILKQAKVKVPAADAVDVESLRTQFHQEIEAKMQERELNLQRGFEERLLTDRYPDWKDTVVKQEFKDWLANEDKASPGYQRTFMDSWSAREIGGVLKKFDAHKAKLAEPPKPKPKVPPPSQSRTERLKEAVLPKASSVTPKPKGPLTEQEAFESVG